MSLLIGCDRACTKNNLSTLPLPKRQTRAPSRALPYRQCQPLKIVLYEMPNSIIIDPITSKGNDMSRFMMNRRGFLSNAAAMGAIAATHSLINVSPGLAADSTTIRMQARLAALQRASRRTGRSQEGLLRREEYRLEIVPGGPNVDGVAGVAVGQSTIGQISSSPSVMLARSAGAPIKAFAAGYQKHPFAYFSRKANPIAKPQDMIGKTIAAIPTSVILLRALLAKNGISEDQVKIVNMGSDMNQLVTGQADAVCGWLTNVNALKVLGDDRVDLTLWDGGIRLYANVYYTTDDQAAKSRGPSLSLRGGFCTGMGLCPRQPGGGRRHPARSLPEPRQGERAWRPSGR